jgi:hypothetical protein
MADPVAIYCPLCKAPFSYSDFHIFDVDGADQCEDGRYGPPTYSISIVCHSCLREVLRLENLESEYGDPADKLSSS